MMRIFEAVVFLKALVPFAIVFLNVLIVSRILCRSFSSYVKIAKLLPQFRFGRQGCKGSDY